MMIQRKGLMTHRYSELMKTSSSDTNQWIKVLNQGCNESESWPIVVQLKMKPQL